MGSSIACGRRLVERVEVPYIRSCLMSVHLDHLAVAAAAMTGTVRSLLGSRSVAVSRFPTGVNDYYFMYLSAVIEESTGSSRVPASR
jgi:hypothetical protein